MSTAARCLAAALAVSFATVGSAQEGRTPIELETPPAFTLDRSKPLRGKLVVDGDVPKDESIELVVSAYRKEEADSSELGEALFLLQGYPTVEVARVAVAADGTFEAPRATDATRVELRVEGDYVSGGRLEFEVGSDDDPGEGPVELTGYLGGHVTVQLDFPEDATPAEKEALVGRTLSVSGLPDRAMGRPSTFSLEIGAGGRVVGRAMPAWDLDHDTSHDMGDLSRCLSPFVSPVGFSFRPVPGKRTTVRVPLERGVAFDVLVRDGDEAPLPKCEVRALHRFDTPRSSGSMVFSAYADEDGTARFHGLPGEVDRLVATMRGHLPAVLEGKGLDAARGEDGRFTVVLDTGTELFGRVVTDDGRPVSGLRVQVTGPKVPGSSGGISASTDEDGRFVLRGVEPRTQTVRANAPSWDYAIPSTTPVTVRLDRNDPAHGTVANVRLVLAESIDPRETSEAGPAVLTLRPAAGIRGRVLAPPGASLAQCQVVHLPGDSMPDADSVRSFMIGERTRVDRSEGTFTIDRLEPGVVTVWAEIGRGPAARRSTPITLDPRVDTAPIELRFPTGGAIAGRVVDETGAPVAGVDVLVSRFGGVGLRQVTRVPTGADGSYAADGLEPGRYSLYVRGTTYVSPKGAMTDLESGGSVDDLTFVARRGGSVRVTLIAPDGAPIAGAAPLVRTPDGGYVAGNYRGEADENGVALIGPIVPGTVRVGLKVPTGDASWRRVTKLVEIEPGAVAEVTIDGGAPARVRSAGTIVCGGEPLEGYEVVLRDASGRLAAATTDALGRYTLEAEATGPATLEVRGATSMNRRIATRTVSLAEGADATADFDLPTGSISGRLLGELPFESSFGFALVAVPAGTPDAEIDRLDGVQLSGSDVFRIRHLAPGRYTLVGLPGRGDEEGLVTTKSVEVTLRSGESVEDVELAIADGR